MAIAAALLCTLRWAQRPTLYCQLDSGVLGFIVSVGTMTVFYNDLKYYRSSLILSFFFFFLMELKYYIPNFLTRFFFTTEVIYERLIFWYNDYLLRIHYHKCCDDQL